MRTNRHILICCILILAAGLEAQERVGTSSEGDALPGLPQYEPQGNEPTAVVMDFGNETFFESDLLGASIGTMLQTALVRSGRVRVIDRDNLSKIRSVEADMSQLGDVLGAMLIISGKVTLLKVTSTGKSTSLTLSGGLASGAGGALTGREITATVTLKVQCFDANLGQVVYEDSVTAVKVSSKVGVALVYHSAALAISGGIEGFDQTAAGIATRIAVHEILTDMIGKGVFRQD